MMERDDPLPRGRRIAWVCADILLGVASGVFFVLQLDDVPLWAAIAVVGICGALSWAHATGRDAVVQWIGRGVFAALAVGSLSLFWWAWSGGFER